MLTQENQVEIRVLARQGLRIRAIARQLGLARNTVRRVLRGKAPRSYGPRRPRPTKLDAYKAYVCARAQAAGSVRLPAPVLLREIREQGYEGSLTQLKVYMASLWPAKKEDPLVRFETEPGQQMQVDFVVFQTLRRAALGVRGDAGLQPHELRAVRSGRDLADGEDVPGGGLRLFRGRAA